MMYWNDHMSTAGGIFSVLATVMVLGLIVAAAVWLVQRSPRGDGTRLDVAADEILARRLASGELSIEQYQQLRAAMAEDHSAATLRSTSPQAAGTVG